MQALMGGVKGSGTLQIPVEKVIIPPSEMIINVLMDQSCEIQDTCT